MIDILQKMIENHTAYIFTNQTNKEAFKYGKKCSHSWRAVGR